MRFWDAFALVPLCLTEPRSDGMKRLAQQDPDLIVWWTSLVECWSAFTRARREGKIDARREHLARGALESLRRGWDEIQPVEEVRRMADRLLRVYPIRAADALQLAAAALWAGIEGPKSFVCLDERLREAAQMEGFTILPEAESPR